MTTILEPGRYWLDLIGKEKLTRFAGWLQNPDLGGSGRVKLEHTEYHEANTSVVPGTPSTPEREWILFQVLRPVMYDEAFYGRPTVAGPNIKSEADTIQSPDVEDMKWVPDFRGAGQGIEDAVKMALGLVVGVTVVAGLVIVGKSVLGSNRR